MVFKTLMSIYTMLVLVNIILTFFLWRSTRSNLLKVLFIHWLVLLIPFVLQSQLMNQPSIIRDTIGSIPNFVIHYSLVWVYASLVGFRLPVMKFIKVYFIGFLLVGALYLADIKDPWQFLPIVASQAFFYLYTATHAFKNYSNQMNYSLKIIGVVLLMYGLFLFTYTFFSRDPLLFAVGFGISLAFHMANSILLPAAVIEILTQEHAKLKTEIEYKAKISQASKMAALGEMAGGLAHEINNPLMSLTLSLELARKNLENKDYDKLSNTLQNSKKTLERVASVVRGLLTFSRQEAAEFQEIDAKEVVKQSLLLCSEKIRINNIELKVELPEGPVIIHGELTLLTQVLLNLINNAFDATLDLPEKWIKIQVRDHSNNVEFVISDSGRITDKNIQEKLFEPFFTTKGIGKGTGLGLSVSKGIVETHSGRIEVAHIDNTKFIVTIPKKV